MEVDPSDTLKIVSCVCVSYSGENDNWLNLKFMRSSSHDAKLGQLVCELPISKPTECWLLST